MESYFTWNTHFTVTENSPWTLTEEAVRGPQLKKVKASMDKSPPHQGTEKQTRYGQSAEGHYVTELCYLLIYPNQICTALAN